MISAWWLLLIVPAVAAYFFYAGYGLGGRDEVRKLLRKLEEKRQGLEQ